MFNDVFYIYRDFYPYLRILDNINNYLTRLIENNENNTPYQNEELFYLITSELLRLIPYKRVKKDSKLVLDEESGVLLLKYKRDFIRESYGKIIQFEPFQKTLNDILTIRNKYIHEPHNISYGYSVGRTSIISMGIYYKSSLLSISSISLSPIIYYLNKVFETILNDIREAVENDDDCKRNLNYKSFINFDFSQKKWHYTILPDCFMFNFDLQ